MEVSALKYSGGIGLHGRTPLLRLQSDERLVAMLRRGNGAAFEVLVSRYETRLLAFCRHLLGSREDAEDVMQEVMTAAFNAMLADDRQINVRPWLYRIARNRSLNHMRRVQAIGVDSMDLHLAEHGASAADKVHEREEFRLLVADIQDLPETQRTALVLREMDALSYEQIAEVMETTVPSVKSLLVRARLSLAEAAEARLLTCEEVRTRLAEVAEGLRRRPDPLVRRHLRGCKRCSIFREQLTETNKALAALMPIGPMVVLKKLLLVHLGHSAGAGSTAAGSGAAGAGAGAIGAGTAGTAGGVVAGTTAAAGSSGFISAGLSAIAVKTAAGIAAAALVTAGAVEVGHSSHRSVDHAAPVVAVAVQAAAVEAPVTSFPEPASSSAPSAPAPAPARHAAAKPAVSSTRPARQHKLELLVPARPVTRMPVTTAPAPTATAPASPPPGRSVTQTDPTVLEPPTTTTPIVTDTTATTTAASPAPATSPVPSTVTNPSTVTATTPTVAATTTTATTPATTTATTPATTSTTPTTTTPTTTTPTTTTPTTTATTPTTTSTTPTTTTTTSQTGTTPAGS